METALNIDIHRFSLPLDMKVARLNLRIEQFAISPLQRPCPLQHSVRLSDNVRVCGDSACDGITALHLAHHLGQRGILRIDLSGHRAQQTSEHVHLRRQKENSVKAEHGYHDHEQTSTAE